MCRCKANLEARRQEESKARADREHTRKVSLLGRNYLERVGWPAGVPYGDFAKAARKALPAGTVVTHVAATEDAGRVLEIKYPAVERSVLPLVTCGRLLKDLPAGASILPPEDGFTSQFYDHHKLNRPTKPRKMSSFFQSAPARGRARGRGRANGRGAGRGARGAGVNSDTGGGAGGTGGAAAAADVAVAVAEMVHKPPANKPKRKRGKVIESPAHVALIQEMTRDWNNMAVADRPTMKVHIANWNLLRDVGAMPQPMQFESVRKFLRDGRTAAAVPEQAATVNRGAPPMLQPSTVTLLGQVVAAADMRGKGFQPFEVIQRIQDLAPHLDNEQCKHQYYKVVLPRAQAAKVICAKGTVATTPTTDLRAMINVKQQWRWHSLVDMLFEFQVKHNLSAPGAALFQALSAHFVLNYDEECLLALDGKVKVVGAAFMRQHQCRGQGRTSITMLKMGNAAGESG